MSISRRATAVISLLMPGRLSRPLAPLMPASWNVATTCQQGVVSDAWRNYLAHSPGDAINAVLAAAGYNLLLLFRIPGRPRPDRPAQIGLKSSSSRTTSQSFSTRLLWSDGRLLKLRLKGTSPPAPQTTATCVRFVTPNLRMICRT
jgi:hypothetical protein